MNKTTKEQFLEGLLKAIDREPKLSKIFNTEVDQDFIDKNSEIFIATLLKDLEKYE